MSRTRTWREEVLRTWSEIRAVGLRVATVAPRIVGGIFGDGITTLSRACYSAFLGGAGSFMDHILTRLRYMLKESLLSGESRGTKHGVLPSATSKHWVLL